jgi:hypothetical protein
VRNLMNFFRFIESGVASKSLLSVKLGDNDSQS